MTPSSALAGLVVLALIGGCGSATRPSAALRAPASDSSTTAVPPTTSTPMPNTIPGVLGATTIPAACSTGGSTLTARPTTARLGPLLLTADQVPPGYTTTGPAPTDDDPAEFYGAVPPSLPTATISFSMDSGSMDSGSMDSGAAGPDDDLVENLAQATSAAAASDLLHDINAVGSECGDAGTIVNLPGDVPGLVASTLLGGTRGEDISSAEVFATHGPYVVELRWFKSLDTYETGVTGPQPALPTPAAMASVADAALVRLPG